MVTCFTPNTALTQDQSFVWWQQGWLIIVRTMTGASSLTTNNLSLLLTAGINHWLLGRWRVPASNNQNSRNFGKKKKKLYKRGTMHGNAQNKCIKIASEQCMQKCIWITTVWCEEALKKYLAFIGSLKGRLCYNNPSVSYELHYIYF